MTLNSNRIFIIALALSGLVHSVYFLWSFSDEGADQGNHYTNVISVQLDISNAQSEKPVEQVEQAEQIEKQHKPEPESLVKQLVQQEPEPVNVSVDTDRKNPQQISEVTESIDQEVSEERQNDSQPETQTASVTEIKLSGEEKKLLLGLLHDRINQYKQYPHMAIRKRREGLVKVNFVLHPDGHISDVMVASSSRYEVLDRAATTAVERVQPLEMASNYLQHSEIFNVDIEFRLN